MSAVGTRPSALAGTIAGMLFRIQATDYPYRGAVRVQPTPFEVLKAQIGRP